MTRRKDFEWDVPRAVCVQRIADRGLDEMIGICRGMTADAYYNYFQGEKERAVGLLPSLGREEEKRESCDQGKKVVNLEDFKKSKKHNQ